jgi:hypothetical protein
MMRRTVDRITVTLHAMPTVTPLSVKLARAGMWLAQVIVAALVVFAILTGTLAVIAKMHATDAQLDTAFMQGMAAGHQLCPRGI